jgi:ABC-2 type transport system ATP-binding protein
VSVATAPIQDLPAVLACDLVQRYPGSTAAALDRFSLQVRPGEWYGLLGVNGAGKTTFISLLCGLIRQQSGSLLVFGRKPNAPDREVKQLLGLVPQELALYEPLTAAENMRYFGRLIGLAGAVLKERIDDCLTAVHLEAVGDKPVSTYSGGMKRRLNLAAGLLGEPRLLVLDEPTVGIDIQSRQLIYERLKHLKRQGTTIFYTTHYLKEAQELCDRIGIVDQGRLVEEGAPSSLLERSGATSLDELLLTHVGREHDC